MKISEEIKELVGSKYGEIAVSFTPVDAAQQSMLWGRKQYYDR